MTGDLRLGDWLIQPRLARASRHGQTVHLRAKVGELLVFLAQHPGEVVSKDTILANVWGTEFISDSALTSVVTELRQTFGDDAASPWLLQTIPKQGYRLIASVETTGAAAASGSVRERWLRRPHAAAVVLIVIGFAIASLAAWVFWSRPEPARVAVVTRAIVPLDPAASLWAFGPKAAAMGRPTRTAFALSSDGQTLVFQAPTIADPRCTSTLWTPSRAVG